MEKEMLFYHLTIDVKQVGEDEVGKDFCEIISPRSQVTKTPGSAPTGVIRREIFQS